MCNSILRIPSDLHQLSSMSPPTAYAYWLRRATRALSHTDFGEWQGYDEIPSIVPGNPPVREPVASKDQYDRRLWTPVSEPFGQSSRMVLELQGFKSAAAAISEIIESPGKWRIDCDHTVQISNLYAMMQTLGVAKFNTLMGAGGGQMRLRPRDSTGMRTSLHFGRDEYGPAPDKQLWRSVTKFDETSATPRKDGTLKVQFIFADGNLGDISTQTLLAQAPPGSRVRWANVAAPVGHEFRHENAVKLQDDVYACGGLINLITRNEYNRKNLEIAMASDPKTLAIDEIEVFEMHG